MYGDENNSVAVMDMAEAGGAGVPFLPEPPKTLMQMVTDIQIAQDDVSDCERRVADANRMLADANEHLATALLSAAPLRCLFLPDAPPKRGRPKGSTTRKSRDAKSILLARTTVGSQHTRSQLAEIVAREQGVDGRVANGRCTVLSGMSEFSRVANGLWKRVA